MSSLRGAGKAGVPVCYERPHPQASLSSNPLDCLLRLQALAHRGPALWLLHHPAKAKRADGQAARGSGALLGFADIVMEMSCVRRAHSRHRRRRICAYSRDTQMPRHLILELDAGNCSHLPRRPIRDRGTLGAAQKLLEQLWVVFLTG